MLLRSWPNVTIYLWKFPLLLGLMSGSLGLVHPGCSNGAMTDPAQEMSLSQRIAQAELIFSGIVRKIEYGLSQGTSDVRDSLPYTYVTYQIERTLKGRSVNEDSLTLRFLGGRAPDDRYLEASNIPRFQVNDRDLLFVERNGEIDCPLVDCQSGRFRVINTGVHAEDGRPMVGIEEGQLIFDNRLKDSSTPLTLHRVQEAILEEVARLYTPQQLQALEPVQSAERGNVDNRPEQPDELPPGVTLRPEKGTGSTSEGDRLESEAFERNRGNPVLNEKN